MIGTYEIRRQMGYHPAPGAQGELFAANRERSIAPAKHFDEMLPPCAEKDQAMLLLRQVLMWANATVARNDVGVNPVPPDGEE